MRARFYHVRQDENRVCDEENCGGETLFVWKNRKGQWQTVGHIYFEAQPNLDLLKKFKRRCQKCGRLFETKYKPHKYSDEL